VTKLLPSAGKEPPRESPTNKQKRPWDPDRFQTLVGGVRGSGAHGPRREGEGKIRKKHRVWEGHPTKLITLARQHQTQRGEF